MREIRQSGSEGGETELNRSSLPLSRLKPAEAVHETSDDTGFRFFPAAVACPVAEQDNLWGEG